MDTTINDARFYVQSEDQNIISIIDLPSHQISGEISTGDRPAIIVIKPHQE